MTKVKLNYIFTSTIGRRGIALAVFFVILMIYLWRLHFDYGTDLIGNLLAEASGLLLGVVFLEAILEAESRRRTLTARFQGYQTLNRSLALFLNIWREILLSCSDSIQRQELGHFSPEMIKLAHDNARLETKNEKVSPVEDLSATMARQIHTIQTEIDRCLLRFGALLDDETIHCFHLVENLTTLNTWRMACEASSTHKFNNFPVFEASFLRDIKTLTEIGSRLKIQSPEFKGLKRYTLPVEIRIQE